MRSHEAGRGIMVSRNEHADINSFSIIALRHKFPGIKDNFYRQIKNLALVIFTNSILPITTD